MKKKDISIVLLVVIVPIVLVLNSTNIYEHVRNKALNICRPALEVSHFFFYNLFDGAKRVYESIYEYRDNESMRQEIMVLRQKNVELNELKAENQRLIDLINFKKTVSVDHIAAQIIGYDVSPWSNWIILNVGSNDGVEKDMPLIAPGGLIGKVVHTSATTSRCILIVDHQSKVSAIIQRSRDSGIVHGSSDNTLTLHYLNINADAQVGDIIVTSGFGGIYPKGIPIGTITVIGIDDTGLHCFAKIKPIVNFSKLEEVVCLKKSK